MSESKKVKHARSMTVIRTLAWWATAWFPKVDQTRLVWMEAQAKLLESLRKDAPNAVSVIFMGEADDEVIRIANQKRAALQPRFDHFLKPDVEDSVKEDVRQKRRDHAALWSTHFREAELPFFNF